ncbi:uncharacterized protein LOC112682615 [Sipha flava]|uniref:Uncharacterized protein LOC112682615 n=1 Tax=Sipha flava TaxID=143950 RepID=A0A2S2QD05_9HEMI|nr:uncharacterized protein LOC112682615 [Sipha flava]
MNSNGNSSNKDITQTNISKNQTVPSLLIKKNRLFLNNEDPKSPSPKSDNKLRSLRKTSKEQNLTNKNTFFSTQNRYSPLELIETIQSEIPSNTNTAQAEVINDNLNNYIIQSQLAENNPKISPIFVININLSEFEQFRREISENIQNNFSIVAKLNKIKVNLQTMDDFRSVTKYLDKNNYDYITYRL